jgi:hypothetical protein
MPQSFMNVKPVEGENCPIIPLRMTELYRVPLEPAQSLDGTAVAVAVDCEAVEEGGVAFVA